MSDYISVMNRGGPEPSCRMSIDNLFNEAKEHGVENCITMLCMSHTYG